MVSIARSARMRRAVAWLNKECRLTDFPRSVSVGALAFFVALVLVALSGCAAERVVWNWWTQGAPWNADQRKGER